MHKFVLKRAISLSVSVQYLSFIRRREVNIHQGKYSPLVKTGHIKLIPLWAGHLLTFGDPSRNKAKIILCSENRNNLNKNK